MPDDSPPVSPDAILSPSVAQLGRAPEETGNRLNRDDAGSNPAGHPLPLALSPKERDTAAHGAGEREGPALTRKSRDSALIAQRDARIKRNAQKIVDAAMLAPTFDEAGPRPEGMTDFEYRCAKANWLPMKVQPGFLAMAQRTLESYKKAEADQAHQPVLNAELVQVTVNQQVNNYPVRVLEED